MLRELCLITALCLVSVHALFSDRDTDESFSDNSRDSSSGSFTNGGRVGGRVSAGNSGSKASSSGNRNRDNSDSSFGSGDSHTSDLIANSGRDRGDELPSASGRRPTVATTGRARPTVATPSRARGFPANFRIEIEVLNMENKGGILADGKSCDVMSSCDPKLYADIDAEKPDAKWPTSAVYNKWPVIFSQDNNNSPVINKVVDRDVCGGNVPDVRMQVNLRVRAVDADSLTQEDDLNRFDCIFEITPRDLGSDPLSARWGEITECKATSQPGKIKLFARQRAYEISSTNCNSKRELKAVDGPKP